MSGKIIVSKIMQSRTAKRHATCAIEEELAPEMEEEVELVGTKAVAQFVRTLLRIAMPGQIVANWLRQSSTARIHVGCASPRYRCTLRAGTCCTHPRFHKESQRK